MAKKTAPLEIVKDPENPKTLQIMEQAIVDCAEGARKLLNSRLDQRAVVLLIQDSCGGAGRISRETVASVLGAAARLDKNYLKLALVALVMGASACAPRVVNCNREPQWWAAGASGKIDTQIKVCFRDDGSLGYRAEPFVPQAPQAEKTEPWLEQVKKIEADLRAEIDALKAKPAPPAPEPPRISDEAMAAKRAAAAKLK